MQSRSRRPWGLIVVAVSIAACAPPDEPSNPTTPAAPAAESAAKATTLYEQLHHFAASMQPDGRAPWPVQYIDENPPDGIGEPGPVENDGDRSPWERRAQPDGNHDAGSDNGVALSGMDSGHRDEPRHTRRPELRLVNPTNGRFPHLTE